MTKRIHAADGICCTCDVVDSSQRVKMHREAESNGGARVWAKHLLLQNTSRLPRRRRVITLYGTFGFRHFTANCGSVGRDYTWLCRAVWFIYFFLLQAQGLLLVICDCNPRRLKKLSKDTKNIILGENNMLNYEQGEIVFIFFFEYTTSLILKAQRVPLVLFFNIKRVKAKPSLFHFYIAGFIFRFNCPGWQ